MKKRLQKLSVSLFILLSLAASAQKFPDEMHMSPDERRLITGNLPYSGFYDSNTIHIVNIQFSGSNYWTTLTNNFPSRTDLSAIVTVDGVVYNNVGVRFKGNSSYSAIGTAQKKSFNISFDDFVHGQNVGGYNTIVLNNCFENPSFMNEIIYEQQVSKHIPSPHGNFAHLYINGQDWGIYDDVEQLNHDYEKEWFMSHTGAMWRARNPPGSTAPQGSNGDSLASLYDFGTDTTFYAKHYYLKSSNVAGPWTKLMTAIRVLDTVSANTMESVLSNYIDIDASLWLIATEDAFTDNDGYLYKGRKDYYIYYEPESGRIIPLEMDGNGTYVNSRTSTSVFYNSTNANLPLVKRLLNVPALRQRYLAHMRTIVKDELDTVEQNSIIDSYYQMIDAAVQADPKKLTTYADFTNAKPLLKSFVKNRRSSILANSEVNAVPPTISNTTFSTGNIAWKRPSAGDSVWVKTTVTSSSGIDHVNLYSGINLVGKFTKTQMFDDGLHNDNSAGDGTYGAVIPGKPGETWVRFYIDAGAANTAKTVMYDPPGAEHDVYTYLVLPSTAIDTSVVINEVMSKNTSTATDSSGNYRDWIELYNNSNQSKNISGYYLTDKKYNLLKWKIPSGTTIPGNSYLIIWADEKRDPGKFHTNYSLSSTHGEDLLFLNSNGELINQISFGPLPANMGFARVPNGTGSFIVQSPTFNANNTITTLPPVANVSANIASGCSPLAVSFINNSQNASNYLWNFGDGSPVSHATTPSHNFTTPGNYTVLFVASFGSLADTDSISISVNASPAISFPSDTITSTSLTYLLDAGAGYSSYHWSTGQNTETISIDSIGSYCVTVSGSNGCTASSCVYIIVNNIVANASTTVSSGCMPLSVPFTNNSLHATSYTWNFGDGSAVSHATSPTHNYTLAGTYNAILIAATGSLSDTDTVSIHVYPNPIINLGPDTITSNTATYLLDAGAGFTSYHWSNNSTTQAITIITAGSYCVTVTNANGCHNSDCAYIILNNIVADASTTVSTGCSPFAVHFTNNSQNATSYTWNYGDGSAVSHSTSPNHTYSSAGTFTATLIAVAGNFSDTDTVIIHVNAIPVFSFIPDTITSNTTTYQLDAGAGFTSYRWNTNETTNQITIDSIGLYCVTVSNTNGCSNSDCVFVIVNTLVANASASDTSGCFPFTTHFVNNSLHASNYSWNFGDGTSISHSTSPTHVYSHAGVFNAILIASIGSLADTDTVIVHVYPVPVFSFPTDTITSNLTSTQLDAGIGYFSYLWSTNETTQTISVSSIGTYCVTVTNNSGCSASDCEFVNLNLLHADVFTTDTAGCLSLNVIFTNNSLHASGYTWDFGDGSPYSNLFSPTHFYSQPGIYLAKLIASSGGMSDTDSIVISVYNNPTINFGADTISVNNATYSLDAGVGNLSYLWSDNETSQVIIIDSVGLYCVTVESMNGCVDSDCVFVIVDPLGIKEIPEYIISLFPDPADEYFTLQSENGEKRSLIIYNSLGDIIYKTEIIRSLIIHSNDWADGIYFLRLGNISKKIVVHH